MHVEVIPKQLVDGMESLDYHENMDSEKWPTYILTTQLLFVPLFVTVYEWII